MGKNEPDFADAAGAISIANDIALQFLLVELVQSGVLPVDRALHVLDQAIACHQKVGGRGWPEAAAVQHLTDIRERLATSVAAIRTVGAA